MSTNHNDNADEIDLDLETSENPLYELKEALAGFDKPPWVAEVSIEIDAETARRYEPAFRQAIEEHELYELINDHTVKEVGVLIDGYDPEYFFEEVLDEE